MRSAALVVVVLILSAARGSAQEHTTDTSDQIKKALADKKAILIDVREQKEWDEGHLTVLVQPGLEFASAVDGGNECCGIDSLFNRANLHAG